MRLGGELDRASREIVEPAVLAAIPTAYTVILDLGDLKFCDSSGVALFVAANEKAKAVGTTLKLGNLNPAVSRVFGITGIDRVLDITEQDRPKPQVTSSISSRSASEPFPPRRARFDCDPRAQFVVSVSA